MCTVPTKITGKNLEKVEFKAGLCSCDNQMIYPDSRKGTLSIMELEHGMASIHWTCRGTKLVEKQILCVSDAYLEKVPGCHDGRVYVLKLTTSDHFELFWMQDHDESADSKHIDAFNAIGGGLAKHSIDDQRREVSSSAERDNSAQACESTGSAAGSARFRSPGSGFSWDSNPELTNILTKSYNSMQQKYAMGSIGGAPLEQVVNRKSVQSLLESADNVKLLAEQMPEGCKSRESIETALRCQSFTATIEAIGMLIQNNRGREVLLNIGVSQEVIDQWYVSSDVQTFCKILESYYDKN